MEPLLRTLGDPLHEEELSSLQDHRIEWYDHQRLHSALGYVTPASVHFGTADRIREERRAKLAAARHRRKEENLKLRQRSLPLPTRSETQELETTANTPLSHFA